MGRPKSPVADRRRFWDQVRGGLLVMPAAEAAGVSRVTAMGWFVEAGGVNPYRSAGVSDRYLSFEEREEIAVGRAAGHSQAQIARALGRAASTVSRELGRNSPVAGARRSRKQTAYRAGLAQAKADKRAQRPKPSRIGSCPRLRAEVQAGLDKHWSPEQICPAGAGLPR